MTIDDKIKRFGERYNINVLGENDQNIVYEKCGYIHKINKNSISKIDINSFGSMLDTSKCKYINDTFFKETPLIALSIDGELITILNQETKVTIDFNLHRVIDTSLLLRLTEKQSKYRNLIIEKLGNSFNYDKCWPNRITDKVTIVCPIHGEWTTTASNILYNNSGCPECAHESVGYSLHIFKKSCCRNNNGKGLLYIVKIKSKDEVFIKVGITSYNTIQNRFKEIRKLGYEVEEIKTYAENPNVIYKTEKYIHKLFYNNKYFPNRKFNGRMECYPIEKLEKILEISSKKIKF